MRLTQGRVGRSYPKSKNDTVAPIAVCCLRSRWHGSLNNCTYNARPPFIFKVTAVFFFWEAFHVTRHRGTAILGSLCISSRILQGILLKAKGKTIKHFAHWWLCSWTSKWGSPTVSPRSVGCIEARDLRLNEGWSCFPILVDVCLPPLKPRPGFLRFPMILYLYTVYCLILLNLGKSRASRAHWRRAISVFQIWIA